MTTAPPTGSQRLTDEERRQLDQDGYVVRPAAFLPEEVTAIVAACERLVLDVAKDRGRRRTAGSYTFEPDLTAELMIKWEGETDVVHGLEPFVHLCDPLASLALDPRFVDPMVDLVGDPEPMLFTEKLNLKRPGIGGRNPLHQDLPYWYDAGAPERTATAMLFLDDADLGNGTLEVIPGSHTRGVWPNRQDGDQFARLEIDPSLEDEVTTVPVEVPAGSLVIFGSLLVHRSATNTSSRQRRSLLYSYQPAGLPHMRDLLRADAPPPAATG